MSAGEARTDYMEITSTANPSLAKPPVSLAIQSDAMVPEVNKYAIRNGRVAAVAAAVTSGKAKNIHAKHHGELILLFIAKTSWT
jgi:hypothetical protein